MNAGWRSSLAAGFLPPDTRPDFTGRVGVEVAAGGGGWGLGGDPKL